MHQVFLGQNESAVSTFLEDTEGVRSPYSFMNQRDFLKITRGRMPLIVMTVDGRVDQVWNYRQFDEEEMQKFFRNQAPEINSFDLLAP